MGEGQDRLVAATAAESDDRLARRVRSGHPGARELAKIAAAHAARTGTAHRLWLDEPAGVLLHSEPAADGEGAAAEVRLHEIPLRSATCTRVLADLTGAALERLAEPAGNYRCRADVDRDIGALVELFRVQLARMRTEHADPAELVRAIHALIGLAADEQQEKRRTAFLGWYLRTAYGNGEDGMRQAEEDLSRDIPQAADVTGIPFVRRTVMDWDWYRYTIRSRVPWSELDRVPRGMGYGRNTHWYYEFRALGRHLTELQILHLRADLPWAHVTSDSLVLDRWGEHDHPVRSSAADVFRQHFDAGLYFDQGGSRTFWLRLPAAFAEKAAPYTTGWGVETAVVGDCVVLELHRQEDDGENSYINVDPRPWLEDLLPLRDDLARGDLRALAIAWRAANVTRAFGSQRQQLPPMPDGLDEDELTPQLQALIRLLEEAP